MYVRKIYIKISILTWKCGLKKVPQSLQSDQIEKLNNVFKESENTPLPNICFAKNQSI